MAIARGAGTEIIRTAHFKNTNSVDQKLIIGVQHHIYTVLSIVIACNAVNAAADKVYVRLKGWNNTAGNSAQTIHLIEANMAVGDVFAWEDKFSFNGYEPLAGSMSGTLSTAAEQDAIADQASAVSQYLYNTATHSSDTYDITVTYIDQNNA